MSESLSIGILLAISGGLMDVYSYLYRGQVFANAQTGNILLLSVYLSRGEWDEAAHYALPIVAFLCGVAFATFVAILAYTSTRCTGDKYAFYLKL